MQASKIGKWEGCQKRDWEIKNNRIPMQDIPVGLYIGNTVHHKITGHEFPEPDKIAYDMVTPSDYIAEVQIKSLYDKTMEILENNNLTIYAKEVELSVVVKMMGKNESVSGHIDLVCEDLDKEIYAVDLKYHKNKPNDMIQQAIYAWLWANSNKTKRLLKGVGVLWVSRQILKHPSKNYFNIISPSTIIQDAQNSIVAQMRYDMIANEVNFANPSAINCSFCPLDDCGVRYLK